MLIPRPARSALAAGIDEVDESVASGSGIEHDSGIHTLEVSPYDYQVDMFERRCTP